MNIISFRKIFGLGSNLALTSRTNYSGGIKVYTTDAYETGLINALETSAKLLGELDISPSTHKEILEVIETIKKRNYKAEDVLDVKHQHLLTTRSKIWLDRVKEDTRNISTAVFGKDHNLNPNKLIEGASSFFEPLTWNSISPIAKRDLEESVKCILFDLPTPSGILALRATEAELRIFYTKKTGFEIKANMNWGAIIKSLRGAGIDGTLIGHLDFLRDNLRNKLGHPDATLNRLEAENIFPTIASTISEMINN